MNTAAREELREECRTLTRYLLGIDPTDYVTTRYEGAHDTLDGLHPSDRFDRLLVRLARGPAIGRWPAAAFARVHAPESALQNKLVTLLAILETAPSTSRVVDTTPARSVAVLLLRLGARGVVASLCLILATAVLLPLRWTLSGSVGRG